ncbi:MAG: hypothetical protein OJF49_004214 [Ktedonobacterales bacterium]|nr:MAG: hypothetical protein OJF49_004214 [Ktedonobacterales bacterium]
MAIGWLSGVFRRGGAQTSDGQTSAKRLSKWDAPLGNNSANDRLERKVARIRRGLVRRPNNALLWSDLGNALARLKRYDEALEAFDRAVELSPSSPVAWNGWGWALCALGRDQARQLRSSARPQY